MRIAIIGVGNVARALALGWTLQGHAISFGVREPRDPRHGTLRSGLVLTVAEASQSADLVVVATSWAGTEEAILSAGDLRGKILIDCTNPFEKGQEGLRLTVGFDLSGGEMVAEWARTASVFKAFNTTSAENMAALAAGARFPVAPMMLVAGEDPAGKNIVLDVVGVLGFEPIDAGPLRNARLLEPLAMLFIELAQRGQGREFAFGLLRR
jgi:8-hydroxy-5-deazaflavin:NADPH oxidoreductase